MNPLKIGQILQRFDEEMYCILYPMSGTINFDTECVDVEMHETMLVLGNEKEHDNNPHDLVNMIVVLTSDGNVGRIPTVLAENLSVVAPVSRDYPYFLNEDYTEHHLKT